MTTLADLAKHMWSQILGPEWSMRPGLDVSNTIDEINAFNDGKAPVVVQDWLVVFDEFLAFFSSVAFAFRLDLLSDGAPSAEKRTFAVLSGCIVSQLIATRRLVLAGLDVPAKQVVRSLNEYIDVATLLSDRHDLIEEFAQADDRDQANKFWHRHMARGRGRAHMWHKMAASLDDRVVDSWKNWRKEEDTVLSLCAHPSYVAASMSNIPRATDNEDAEGWPGFFGVVGSFSERTLCYAVTGLLDYVVMGKMPSFDDETSLKTEDEFVRELHAHIQAGRKVLPALFFRAMYEMNARESVGTIATTDRESIVDA